MLCEPTLNPFYNFLRNVEQNKTLEKKIEGTDQSMLKSVDIWEAKKRKLVQRRVYRVENRRTHIIREFLKKEKVAA